MDLSSNAYRFNLGLHDEGLVKASAFLVLSNRLTGAASVALVVVSSGPVFQTETPSSSESILRLPMLL